MIQNVQTKNKICENRKKSMKNVELRQNDFQKLSIHKKTVFLIKKLQ